MYSLSLTDTHTHTSMGRVREEGISDLKSQLVTEICNISRPHWHGGGSSTRSSAFIDWYLVLGVEENAGLDVIRKQYHKLALQLHPDKNKHPKAEIAFKLVLEAHACLCDNAKRAEFNLERQNINCIECNRVRHTTCNTPDTRAAKFRGLFPSERSRSQKIKQCLKDLRARFAEEAKVIENCLRSNTESTKEYPVFNPTKESPVFNPSDYLFQGYPHRRIANIHRINESFKYLGKDNIPNFEQRTRDSPVFEFRSRSGAKKF